MPSKFFIFDSFIYYEKCNNRKSPIRQDQYMKRALFILSTIIFVFSNGFAQGGGNPINWDALKLEPWYTDLDSALKTPDKVYKLSLTGKDLKKLPPEIGQLKNLQILNLNDNKLKALPPEIGDLGNLQVLSLLNNNLRYIPDEFRKLKSLEVLYLGKNKIVEMPVWIGGLGKLRRLDLVSNRMTPYELNFLKELLPRCYITY